MTTGREVLHDLPAMPAPAWPVKPASAAGDADIARTARALAVMAHPIRLRILLTLGEDEVSVLNIARTLGIAPGCASKHLTVLHRGGVVATRRDAARVYYRVANVCILQVIVTLCLLQDSRAQLRPGVCFGRG